MIWPSITCLYMIVGGQLAPLLIPALFARDRSWTGIIEVVPAFVVVTAVIALWPVLLLLALEAE